MASTELPSLPLRYCILKQGLELETGKTMLLTFHYPEAELLRATVSLCLVLLLYCTFVTTFFLGEN